MSYKTPEKRAAYAREWRAKNVERAREIDKKKRDKQPAGVAATRMREWRAANPERAKESAREQNKAWRENNKEHRLKYERKYREENIDQIREYNARWHRENRANNPEKVRAMHLKSLYGLTSEQYNQMLAGQNGHCAVCSRTPDEEHHKVLHIDHDHTTGLVRGLLCSRCNTGYGLLGENLDGVIAYAKKHTLTRP